eukprot:TRINITY_DN5260_c0_g2_i1.p2 TRINITY_DN5260_c0_g2~~TRINITY_DN5260_c0_g2_i1.p2  ORF type:complete len:262 (-),score=36.00 TRINITY_DN5260_c0_g2_i1:185-970(-)
MIPAVSSCAALSAVHQRVLLHHVATTTHNHLVAAAITSPTSHSLLSMRSRSPPPGASLSSPGTSPATPPQSPPLPHSSRTLLDHASPLPVNGAFVSFKTARGGHLRSCMGCIADTTLLAALDQAARSAVADQRFEPLSVAELPALHLEVHVMHSRRTLPTSAAARFDSVVIGRHGLELELGRRRGVLLATVPVEQGWDVPAFLDALCRKAGLASGAWRDPRATLWAFEEDAFTGPATAASYPAVSPDELRALAGGAPAEAQ